MSLFGLRVVLLFYGAVHLGVVEGPVEKKHLMWLDIVVGNGVLGAAQGARTGSVSGEPVEPGRNSQQGLHACTNTTHSRVDPRKVSMFDVIEIVCP